MTAVRPVDLRRLAAGNDPKPNSALESMSACCGDKGSSERRRVTVPITHIAIVQVVAWDG